MEKVKTDPKVIEVYLGQLSMMKIAQAAAASELHLSPCGRGVGRLRRPFSRTPKRSFGYVASPDAIRVRGCALSWDRSPHPNCFAFEPLPVGER